MLRLFKRHEEWCAKTSKKDLECKPKVKGRGPGSCIYQVSGRLPDGTLVKPKSLETRNKEKASQKVLEMDARKLPEPPKKKADTLRDARDLFLISKNKKSKERQRKLASEANRVIEFLAAQTPPILNVEDVTLPVLTVYMGSWTDANTTQISRRENLTAFFRYCVKAKFIGYNPASDLETISDVTPQTDVFSHDELRAIFATLPKLVDEYGRTGGRIALLLTAFVYVMRYTGLSIGDVAGLTKSAVHGNRIITNRDKTGKEVYVKVPDFVIAALDAAPHDSNEYFFWSGNGLIHTRTSKWGERLQKLFVLAGVRLHQAPWTVRATRSKKSRAANRVISGADPRWFRHTLARDLLENEIVTMAELAEILGNTEEICVKHYSKWDKRRQNKIDAKLDKFWKVDPLFDQLA